ncbi:MAG: DUF1080 domain-containing protein [Gemmataceae bacterium]|nr:DUF1080 domain-containing protein [Gemmataceae bacterium]
MFRSLLAVALLALATSVSAQDKDKEKDKPKPNTLTPKEIADGWILLFDGETTFGWTAGSAAVSDDPKPTPKVKDGALVVVGESKTGTRLHARAFGDYELSFEVKRNGPSKASVGIEVLHRTENGETGSSISGRVVDTSLCPNAGEWYAFSVKAGDGPNNTYSYAYTGKDEKPTPTSTRPNPKVKLAYASRLAITLEPGGEVMLRNIKLRPLNANPLFTGKNLDGWKVNEADPKRVASKWEVTKDGELSVKNGPGDLVSEKEFDNFVLQLECKTNGKALNSGVFFRCIPGQYQNGYEAQIQNAYKDDDRTKPADFGTGAIYRRVPVRKVVSNDNEWFTMTVVADGKHIATWVNGYQTVDWTDDRKEHENPRNGFRAAKGPISIQGHDPTTDILFRNIRIVELPAGKK